MTGFPSYLSPGDTSAQLSSAAVTAPPWQPSITEAEIPQSMSKGAGLQSHQAGWVAAGNNAATLVREIFSQQHLPPASPDITKARIKQLAYRLLRAVLKRPPLSEDVSSRLMHAQHSIESITQKISLGAADKRRDLENHGVGLVPYDWIHTPLMMEMHDAFFNPANRLHALWPDALREEIASFVPEKDRREEAVKIIVRVAFAGLRKSAKGMDLALLGVMDAGATLQGSHPAAQRFRIAHAGDYSWFELIDPNGEDVIVNAWAKDAVAICRSDAAAYVESYKQRTNFVYKPEAVQALSAWVVQLSDSLAGNESLAHMLEESAIKYQDKLMDEVRSTLDILNQLQERDIPVNQLSGIYNESPSAFSGKFRAAGRQALRKIESTDGDEDAGKHRLEAHLFAEALEMDCSDDAYQFVNEHKNEIIDQAKEMVRESKARRLAMKNGDEREFDKMRSSLPNDPVALVLQLNKEPDFSRWQLGLMHLQDILHKKSKAEDCEQAVRGLISWWRGTQLLHELDSQIAGILTDSLILDIRKTDMWMSIMYKVWPLIALNNLNAPYLRETMKSSFKRILAQARQEKIDIQLILDPIWKEFPDFYQKELAPLLSPAS